MEPDLTVATGNRFLSPFLKLYYGEEKPNRRALEYAVHINSIGATQEEAEFMSDYDRVIFDCAKRDIRALFLEHKHHLKRKRRRVQIEEKQRPTGDDVPDKKNPKFVWSQFSWA